MGEINPILKFRCLDFVTGQSYSARLIRLLCLTPVVRHSRNHCRKPRPVRTRQSPFNGLDCLNGGLNRPRDWNHWNDWNYWNWLLH